MAADWTAASARSFQALYNGHFSLNGDSSVFTPDFVEPGYNEDGSYNFMLKDTLRARMRNGLLTTGDMDKGELQSNVPSSRYSQPFLTHEQRFLLGAAQRVAVEPDTSVPVLESIFPFMMDFTTRESERAFALLSGQESKDEEIDETNPAVGHSTQSRMTLGSEHAERSIKEVKEELEKAREAGMNLFKRDVAFRGGTSFVRIFRGRRFFEVGHPSAFIRYEMIPKSDSKGVTATEREMLRNLSDLTFHQTRFLDVRLAILITSMVEKARMEYNSFFSPPLRVARVCKMQGESFGVVVNDAWSGNLGGWIRSFDISQWSQAMARVEEYLAADFVNKKLSYLNRELNIQHGDLKVDNVVYINIGTGGERGDVVPHFGFIDFGVSSLYKKVEPGQSLRERMYRSSLFAANTGQYLDQFLDVSYLQYSLRFAFLAHFGVANQDKKFFDAFKSWFPLIGFDQRGLKIYKWRQEKYAGTEDGKAWVHEDDSITVNQMSMLDISDPNNIKYPKAELYMTVAEIARRRMEIASSGDQDDSENSDEESEDQGALARMMKKTGPGTKTLTSIIADVYKEREDLDLDTYRF